jgi:hypothetical protein
LSQLTNYFNVKFHTKPYLKKYFEAMYGDPLIFTTNNLFGVVFASLLERPLELKQSPDKLRMRVDVYEQLMEVHCPINFLTRNIYGFEVKAEHVISLNKLFEERFDEDLFRFCFPFGLTNGIERKEALELFCNAYGLEIDVHITWDALKQKEYRFRKNMETSFPKVSSPKQANVQFALAL